MHLQSSVFYQTGHLLVILWAIKSQIIVTWNFANQYKITQNLAQKKIQMINK